MSLISITHVLPTFAAGGAERMVLDLVSTLDRQRFSSDVVTFVGSGPLEAEFRRQGIAATVLPVGVLRGLSAMGKLERHFKTRAPAIAHLHLSGSEMWGERAARRAGIPRVVITVHNTDVDEPAWRTALRRRVWQRADAVVAVSNAVRDYLVAEGAPAGKVTVIPNGIELGKFPYAEHARQSPPVLCALGRLDRQKGHDVLLRALAAVARPWTLRLGGDGPLRARLQKRATELKIAPRVQFFGTLTDVPSFMKSCDILVHPSRWEGQGRVVLEAAASGLPIVATAVGGIPEMIQDGVSGRLVPPNDASALATAITRTLDNPDESRTLTRAARRIVEGRFTLAGMVQSYSSLYASLLP